MYHHLNLKASHTYMFHMLTDGESWWNFLISWIYSQFAKEKVKLITFLRYCMKTMFMLWKHTIVDKYMYIRFHNWWMCEEANGNRAWITHTFVKTGKIQWVGSQSACHCSWSVCYTGGRSNSCKCEREQ